MADLPEPLTPADCDLREYPFMPLEVKRLLTSETWILGTGEERAAAIALWLESWHQVPAASLPDNDRMLAHLSQAKNWKKVKPHALRGWVHCSDGKIYHPVVAEKVLEGWIGKLLSSLSGSAGNAKRWGIEVDTDAVKTQIIDAVKRLQAIAPQSDILKKKQVRDIASGSPPDEKSIAPRSKNASPPDSGCDRNREGEGEGDREVKPSASSQVVGTSAPVAFPDDHVPTTATEWAKFFDVEHGIQTDTYSPRGREKFWPLATAWIATGLTIGRMRAAIAKAKADTDEPIMYLPGYVNSVMVNAQGRPEKQPKAPPLHTLTDVELENEARKVGAHTQGKTRDQVISAIQAKRKQLEGVAA